MAATFQGFRSLIENSPDGFSLVDSSGEIVYGSPSTARILGYKPEELLGRNCLEFFHPDDRDQSSLALREVVAKPAGPFRWDARLCGKGGDYSWVESTASNLLFDLDVQAIVMHQRVIDERKSLAGRQHAQELAAANSRLQEFAYVAAHDLREPLRTLSSIVDALIARIPPDAEATRLADLIGDGAGRMSSLVNDLLSFATTGMHAPPSRVDFEEVVAQVRRNLAPAIESCGATITTGPLPVVPNNEILLVRLLQNLLSNSLAYRSEDPPRIHVFAEPHGKDWAIGVRDNGAGIAPKYHDRIFLPFKRLVNRDIPGSGLGLAICKRIVERLGGAMWVESEAGAGATFYFTIPALTEGVIASQTAAGESQFMARAIS